MFKAALFVGALALTQPLYAMDNILGLGGTSNDPIGEISDIGQILGALSYYGIESYLHLEGFAYSEPMPFDEFTSDWSSGFDGGNNALAYTWLEAGIQTRHWGFALFHQQYAQMHFSDDAAELYYLTENKLPIETGRAYNIDVDINAFSTRGVRLFHRISPHKSLDLKFGASYLTGGELLEGRINGQVTASSDRDYDFDNVHIDYYYSADKLFDRAVTAPNGNGAALDLTANWQATPYNRISLNVRNLAGYIHWKNSPYTTAQIQSNNKDYDENGYVTVNPTLSGWHLNSDHKQRLPLIWQGEMEHKLSTRRHVDFRVLGSEVKQFYQLGGSYQFRRYHWLQLLYTLNSESVSIAYRNPWLQIQLQREINGLGESHTQGLLVHFQLAF